MLVLLQRGGGGVVLGIAEVDKAALGWPTYGALARALDGGSGWLRSGGGGVRKEVDVDVLVA